MGKFGTWVGKLLSAVEIKTLSAVKKNLDALCPSPESLREANLKGKVLIS